MRVKFHLALITFISLSFSCLVAVPEPQRLPDKANLHDPKSSKDFDPTRKLDSDTDAQVQDQQKVDEMLKTKPDWVKNEWIEKYGFPKDYDDDPCRDPWYGYESEARAALRQNISAAGMRCMDASAEMVRNHSYDYSDRAMGQGVVCADHGFAIYPYLLTGINPEYFTGGPNDWSNTGQYETSIIDYGYERVNGGNLQAGDLFTGGHAGIWWQTRNDALGLTSTPNGAGLAQYADDGYNNNWDAAGVGGDNGVFGAGAVYRMAHRPYLEDMKNLDGSNGPIAGYIPDYWTNIRQNTPEFKEPQSYMRLSARKKNTSSN
jgi:hypothetical protein